MARYPYERRDCSRCRTRDADLRVRAGHPSPPLDDAFAGPVPATATGVNEADEGVRMAGRRSPEPRAVPARDRPAGGSALRTRPDRRTPVLLVARLVLTYFVLRDPEPIQATPPRAKPVRFNWSDGTELQPVTASAKLLVEQAKRELELAGMTGDVLSRNGYTIDLTVDRVAQELGERVLDEARQGQPANLRIAMVAVDPRTGRVVAWNGYQPEKLGSTTRGPGRTPGTRSWLSIWSPCCTRARGSARSTTASGQAACGQCLRHRFSSGLVMHSWHRPAYRAQGR